MNASAVAPRTGFKFMLSVRSGPDAGAQYQLLPPRITIGRDPASNNVVVNDPRVSRNAAIIEFSPEQIEILDISGKGKLTVNGMVGERQSIKGGDVLRIGESEMIFVVEAMQLPAMPNHSLQTPPVFSDSPLQLVGDAPPRSANIGGAASPHGQQKRRSQPKKQSKPVGFYVVVAAIFAGLIYVGTSDPAGKKLDKGLRSTSEIEKEITDTDARTAEAVKKRTFRTEEEKTRYDEAQKHYLEGFRDYQKGNYTRAMRSFETARAIDPEHVLSRRYYRQAEKQRDEAVTQLQLEGRRYREKNMFARCVSALDKAMVLMTNKDDLKYKQAESMKKECETLLDNRF